MGTDFEPNEGLAAEPRLFRTSLLGLSLAVVVTAASTALAFVLGPWVSESDQVMLLLLGVLLVAYRSSFPAAMLAVALSVAAFDFVFVPPFYTFAVESTRHLLTFVVMGVLASTVALLVWRVRSQAAERAALARQTHAARVQLETERLRNSLLSSISHDLRTPVASIAGAIEVLLDSSALDDDARRSLLEGASEEAARLRRLLDNALEMTRIEGGGLKLDRQWLVPEETVGATVRRLSDQLETHSVTTRIEADLGYYDEPSVETALVNLVENAVRYSAEGSTIEIRVDVVDGALRFVVSDEGIGFGEEDPQRLFEKFTRGANARGTTGSGIGLAIVSAVAAAHGGSAVARRLEAGAEFRIELPQDVVPPAAPEDFLHEF